HRIKILGKAEGEGPELITQAAFVDRVIRLISGKPAAAMDDKDRLKRGKKLVPADNRNAQRLVFRNFFIGEADERIAKVLWNYFVAVSDRWRVAWQNMDRGNVLPRTTGFAGLMRFLPHALGYIDGLGRVPSKREFLEMFEKVRIGDEDFNTDNYKPGSSGEGQLVRDFKSFFEKGA